MFLNWDLLGISHKIRVKLTQRRHIITILVYGLLEQILHFGGFPLISSSSSPRRRRKNLYKPYWPGDWNQYTAGTDSTRNTSSTKLQVYVHISWVTDPKLKATKYFALICKRTYVCTYFLDSPPSKRKST